MDIKKSCLFCKTTLENALPDDIGYQPYAGGEVIFSFAFGSCQFDENIATTNFRAFICDDCANKYVAEMKKD